MRSVLTEALFAQVPDAWLIPEPGVLQPEEKRRAYVRYLSRRLNAASPFVEEAIRARANLI